MTSSKRQRTLLALLAAFAVLTASQAIAACCEVDCCADEAEADHCDCCSVGVCGVEDAELALLGPALVLAEPATIGTEPAPDDDASPPEPVHDPPAAIPACVTTTVLLI
jgi:hypothetical protein